MRGEGGGIVTGWLLKLIVSIAILGLVVFEAGAIILAHVNADAAATEVAGAAATSVASGGNAKAAEQAARAEAAAQHVTLVEFSLADDHKTVTVIVEKTAKTLLVHRLSWTKSWTVVHAVRRRPVPG